MNPTALLLFALLLLLATACQDVTYQSAAAESPGGETANVGEDCIDRSDCSGDTACLLSNTGGDLCAHLRAGLRVCHRPMHLCG